jgi:hypothetical protein
MATYMARKFGGLSVSVMFIVPLIPMFGYVILSDNAVGGGTPIA